MIRPSSSSARARGVGRSWVWRVLIKPPAWTKPSFNEPAKRKRSSQYWASAGDGDGVEAGKLVGDQIVIGDAALRSKIFRVGSGMDCSNRHDEAKAIRRSDIG